MSAKSIQYFMNLYMKELPDPPNDFNNEDTQKKHILQAYLTNKKAIQQAHRQIAQIIDEPLIKKVQQNFLRIVLPHCQIMISSSVLDEINKFYIVDEGHNDMIAFVKEKLHYIFDKKLFNHTYLDRLLRNITKKQSNKKQLRRCEFDAFVTSLLPQTDVIQAKLNSNASFADIQKEVDQQFKGQFIHHDFIWNEDESANKSQCSERYEPSNVNTFETVLNCEPDCGQKYLAADSFSLFKCNQFQNISVTGSCPDEFEETQ
ncbi:Hypothetical_protein [Hexamita inflata]|uniref:Hypothetical_protein n=1 Tax=Hexamita inflata TaxID=28002 RepID=A0AA86Q8B6_9EUKA|nr:Hypothetical protein HINF_LOCUS41781 [Hexamita inflata]